MVFLVYLNDCLLERMSFQDSSARAPERLNSSKSFLQTVLTVYNQSTKSILSGKSKREREDHVLVIMDRNSPLFIVESNVTLVY